MSNLGQTQGASYGANNYVNAQAFTAGSHARGYVLSSIDTVLESSPNASQRETIRAELWSVATGGAPNVKIADLEVPPQIGSASTTTFYAPANTVLAAGTSYFFLLYTTGTYDLRIDHVTTTGEDSGAATGWSIADDRYYKNNQQPGGGNAWTSASNPVRITVRGSEIVTAPSVPQNVQVTPGDAQLTITWEAPSSWGDWPAGGFCIQQKISSEAQWSGVKENQMSAECTTAPTQTSYTYTGPQTSLDQGFNPPVTNGTAYDLRIAAFNQDPHTDGRSRLGSFVTVTGTPAAASSDNALSGLTASSSTSATGTFTSLPIGTFSSTTTSYTATVANARTHVKLTPTANHASASISWRKGSSGAFAPVTSGSATSAISLGVGANAITVRVTAEDSTTQDYTVTVTREEAPVAVSLSASPNPVPEGSSVTVTATLSRALSSNVTIPVTLTAGSAESGDHGSLSSITINSGSTSGTGQITTAQDTDADDETFTVALGTLTSPLTAGATRSVEITIRDDEGLPTVSLSVSPNPVPEGSSVEVMLRVSQPPSQNVDIPVTVTRGTSESGDHGSLSSIAITAGATSGTGTITTAQDSDEDDETFTVALGTLPSPLTAGTTSSVTVKIVDDDGLRLSVDTSHPTPACDAAVTDLTVRPEMGLRLTPPPAAEADTQVRILASYGPAEGWRASLPIRKYDHLPTYGHSNFVRSITFAELRKNFPGFRGFEYRLKGTPAITAQCTWEFDGDDGDMTGMSGQSPDTSPGTAGELGAVAAPGYAALIAQMREWRNDPQWVHTKAHTDRWDRALLALGETVSDTSLTPMTAAEAQGYADQGWERWVEVAQALRELEADDDTPAPQTLPAIRTDRAIAREWTDNAVVFNVQLDRPAAGPVTVDYATADGHGRWAGTVTATAGTDYTATAGTLTFAAGETWTSVSVPILGDAIDEGTEYFLLRFSNPQGADLAASHRETQGLIRNGEAPAQDPPALHGDLIGQMYGWRADPLWVSYKSHTDRWDRALLSFGEPVADTSLTPMTDSEAQQLADGGLSRWVGVAAALKTVVTGIVGDDDSLTGTSAGELLVGLGGDDALSAGGGDDELRGGSGDDFYTGGAGADRFVFFSGDSGEKEISDFRDGNDRIVLKGDSWDDVADIIALPVPMFDQYLLYTLKAGVSVITNTPLRTEDFVAE